MERMYDPDSAVHIVIGWAVGAITGLFREPWFKGVGMIENEEQREGTIKEVILGKLRDMSLPVLVCVLLGLWYGGGFQGWQIELFAMWMNLVPVIICLTAPLTLKRNTPTTILPSPTSHLLTTLRPPPFPPSDRPSDATSTPQPTDKTSDRLARFKALRLRAQQSSQSNLRAAAAESKQQATDPNALTALQRKQAIASHKLLKADVESEGGDFERKRAWDWTIEESEKWDERMERKKVAREGVAFQDYASEAGKIYERQVREMGDVKGGGWNGAGGGGGVDKEAYEREKAEMVMRAARSGGLEIVETEDGELVAVDKTGTFYTDGGGAGGGGTGFVDQKPAKKNVDRLVKDLQKAEETRLRKRRERRGGDEGDEDITFINEKNKQFNQKLARFYNKYTAEIRESFERGTMI
ncbi:uncharacterized protein KY384_002937 [Bacidia gigantensis]|uniref:uncharacterized protein n=1 Tax=Bacidia gigantensis TaxID=2732470 RepID=UPI001D036EBB|nr:uncharacterized protein KY384_002937 [Bacidia gigantensis]KAG8531309.1 hypothetical protein KY384_002937 [Bacidia gigantensis]